MSSAILYLAIVAIWAVVLVPRWLRHPHAAPQPAQTQEELQPASEPAPTAAVTTGDAGSQARQAPAAGAAPPPAARPQHPRAGPDHHRAPGPARPSPAARRARILRARRRTLSTLVLLAAVAAGLAVAHLAAWWVTVAPGVMLGGFLVLLRTAASIDAQRAMAQAQAASQRAEAQARAEAEAAAAAPAEDGEQAATAEAGAEIIDISARVGDQLYDQYTDAQARAIGD